MKNKKNIKNVENSKRIVKNVLFLYSRMIVTICISLYTSRLVLQALGVQDFGVYSVVGGIVTMLSFVSASMSSAIQRFLSFELGLGDLIQFENVFKMSVNIFLGMTFIILVPTTVIGSWYVNEHLVVATDRLASANWVLYCSLISLGLTILSIPYISCIIANEKMGDFAYLSVVDVLLKLSIAIGLSFKLGDDLKVYAVLSAALSLVMWMVYYIYCKLKFSTTKYGVYWDKDLFKTLVGYTGWSLFGNFAAVCFNQGINVLLNIFFGPAVNASRAIAYQINAALKGFVINLGLAVNPQITKSYAREDHSYMMQLILNGSKYSFFLLYLLVLPVLLNTEIILLWWLGVVPEYAVEFCQLILFDSLIACFSGTLMAGIQATGDIKKYQLVVGGILILNIPVSYYSLEAGYPPQSTMLIMITLSLIALFARIMIIDGLISSFSIRTFCEDVLMKSVFVAVLSAVPFIFMNEVIVDTITQFMVLSLMIVAVTLSSIWLVGLSFLERKFIISRISKALNKKVN